jgi:hypothetical protein
MVQDRAKVQPVGELLQKFHGSKYISSIDLSSAFLQIELDPDSRKFTAFVFESRVFQFTRVPYGFKNFLYAFVRALNLALDSTTYEFALCYVDITVHSATFAEHLEHLKIVIGKLTSAGFTINAKKCNFCRPEITFLGYVISNGGIQPDRRRLEAILAFPAPKNQRQLKKF